MKKTTWSIMQLSIIIFVLGMIFSMYLSWLLFGCREPSSGSFLGIFFLLVSLIMIVGEMDEK